MSGHYKLDLGNPAAAYVAQVTADAPIRHDGRRKIQLPDFQALALLDRWESGQETAMTS